MCHQGHCTSHSTTSINTTGCARNEPRFFDYYLWLLWLLWLLDTGYPIPPFRAATNYPLGNPSSPTQPNHNSAKSQRDWAPCNRLKTYIGCNPWSLTHGPQTARTATSASFLLGKRNNRSKPVHPPKHPRTPPAVQWLTLTPKVCETMLNNKCPLGRRG
jgi:hypothetical protein